MVLAIMVVNDCHTKAIWGCVSAGAVLPLFLSLTVSTNEGSILNFRVAASCFS